MSKTFPLKKSLSLEKGTFVLFIMPMIYDRILYIAAASSLRTFSATDKISAFVVLAPKRISITSPILTSAPAFATLPFNVTLPASAASFATVRLFIIREVLRYLSNLIVSPYRDVRLLKSSRLLTIIPT
jgi:hypothetical protein